MKVRNSARRPLMYAVAMIAIVVMAGIAFCAFDRHEAMSAQELCGAMIATTIAMLVLVGPLVGGAAVSFGGPRIVAVPVHTLDPPPKAARLF